MNRTDDFPGGITCFVLAAVFVLGFVVLGVRLKAVQIDEAADYGYANVRQSVRRVQTDGRRGRIRDRRGLVLAENRHTVQLVCDAAFFSRRTWAETVRAISNGVARVGAALGRPSPLTARDISRHVNQRLARPLVAWNGLSERELAVFSEREGEFPGFACRGAEERVYPYGSLAAHALGYVGRDEVTGEDGDERFSFRNRELRGRAGLEAYYDVFLRGVPGEEQVTVDARGFARASRTVVASRAGPDLDLTLDARVQHAAERELRGERGACVVLDPRNGEILAFASAPSYDLNRCVPVLSSATYRALTNDTAHPLLNRASGGTYAPGSTFKPVTALAGLSVGVGPLVSYECSGVYFFGEMHLRCASRWGHGPVDLTHALMKSCNPYFCNLGVTAGTNALCAAARALGLGAPTGVDFATDRPGVVPDAAWKRRTYGEPWYPGDLPQMAIGQGMLLVTPLQMARLAGAIGTGYLVTPRFKRDLPAERKRLPFPERTLRIVRDGMRLVVTGDVQGLGTGRRGGAGVNAHVSGKTGTAEVGLGENRRKNTWFIAYAPSEDPRVAVAMVIENGESGGGTTAPKVATVLRTIFGGTAPEGSGT